MSRLEERLASLRAEHAPDPRLEVWEVEVVSEGSVRRLTGATTSSAGRDALREAARQAGAEFGVRPLPDHQRGGALRGVAHRSVAHLRREPSHAAELVHQLLLGEEALVLREEGEWVQVRTADPYVAWTHRGSLLIEEAEDAGAFQVRLESGEPPPGTWIVVGRGAVARNSSEPGAAAVADLVQGGRVRVERRAEGAVRVVLPDGTEGWVPAGDAVPADRLPTAFPRDGAAVVAHAGEFLGLPYLWGGASEKGFDCSGLVQRIWGLHGVRLPRDSDQQAGSGAPVDPGEDWSGVAAGDLAFFAPEGGRVSHVGLLAREGRLLHASTTRNGVAWDALSPQDPSRSEFGARLAGWLTGIRRVRPEGSPAAQ
ncbi:MAG: NlpC/P60 family protein [Gemmatimonadota bacterium]|nr:NlpC/P60 family protein [Gemmatimonadota bacterium]